MACSFAAFLIVSIFVLYSALNYHCRAEKGFLFKKGNLWARKWKIEGGGGLSWYAEGTGARSCDDSDNWFYLKYMYAHGARRVFMELEYHLYENNCSVAGCGLFLRYYKGINSSTKHISREDFSLKDLGSTTTKNRKVTTIHLDMGSKEKYFSLAVQTKGVCVVVYNISIYYYYCPKYNTTSMEWGRIPAPSSGSTIVTIECDKYSSHAKEKMGAICHSNGSWENFDPQQNLCHCSPGYEFDNDTRHCTQCRENHFKENDETVACKPCPENTYSLLGATTCSCKENYYRNSENGACRTIPSKPEQLNFTRLQNNQILLMWNMPSNSHDHDDLRFKVKCNQKVVQGGSWDPCVNTSISKEGVYLTGTNLTVSRLLNNTHYNFTVFSMNNISEKLLKTSWSWSSILMNLSGNIPPTVATTLHVTSEESSPSSDKIQQTESGGSSGKALGPLIGGAMAGLLIILIIIAVIFYRSRRIQKGTFEEEMALNGNEQAYVDPAKYGNPEKAVRKFAKEIDRRQVKLEGLIGEGEFARVHKGLICSPNEPAISVAIKVLKPGSSAKNREDFLTEAAVMAQFKDMNIVALEGVVTISHPVMIITEFMHNGALSKFLGENKSRLSEIQLLTMARGVASGMKYLARMRYVHRDLAARNVLVNENLVCKVADFGLTRELEESCQGEYVTQGGKIPIRWTAPEAYKHRRFTTASDVWSYGILLWEIMSYAERPYGNWDNYMVMDQVNENYRLTAPMNCPKIVHQLMMECWKADRSQRPAFADIVEMLDRWIRNPYLLKDYEYVTEKNLMADRKSCVAKSIREYLETIKMGRYVENFIDFGYTELYQIQNLNDDDLVGIGVPLVGHRNKIMKSLSMRSEKEHLLPADV